MFIAQNGKIEAGEGDADADEAGVAAVSAVSLPTTNGTGDQMLTNTGERDAVVTMEGITGADLLLVETASREEEGDAGDMVKTPTTFTGDPLLTMVQTHYPHLRRRTPRTRHHLSPLRHRTRSPLPPLLDHL